jgi:hypothetical protein
VLGFGYRREQPADGDSSTLASEAARVARVVAPERILCLRHAEEPAKPVDDEGPGFDADGRNESALSIRGWQRAGALAATELCQLLEGTSRDRVAIFVPDYDGEPERHRSHQTVVALSQRLDVEISHPCNKDEVDKLQEAVFQHDGVAVVCWQHANLARFAQGLVDDPQLEWPSGRYDLIWELRPAGSDGTYTCERIGQRLLADDDGLC